MNFLRRISINNKCLVRRRETPPIDVIRGIIRRDELGIAGCGQKFLGKGFSLPIKLFPEHIVSLGGPAGRQIFLPPGTDRGIAIQIDKFTIGRDDGEPHAIRRIALRFLAVRILGLRFEFYSESKRILADATARQIAIQDIELSIVAFPLGKLRQVFLSAHTVYLFVNILKLITQRVRTRSNCATHRFLRAGNDDGMRLALFFDGNHVPLAVECDMNLHLQRRVIHRHESAPNRSIAILVGWFATFGSLCHCYSSSILNTVIGLQQ